MFKIKRGRDLMANAMEGRCFVRAVVSGDAIDKRKIQQQLKGTFDRYAEAVFARQDVEVYDVMIAGGGRRAAEGAANEMEAYGVLTRVGMISRLAEGDFDNDD